MPSITPTPTHTPSITPTPTDTRTPTPVILPTCTPRPEREPGRTPTPCQLESYAELVPYFVRVEPDTACAGEFERGDIVVAIENRGVKAAQAFYVYVNGDAIRVDRLDANTALELVFWNVPLKVQTVIVVDSTDAVYEMDEGNNELLVSPPTPCIVIYPDPTPLPLGHSKFLPIVQDARLRPVISPTPTVTPFPYPAP